MDWNESKLENDDLESYKAKAEFYIRQHQDNAVIAKLKSNIPLNSSDMIEYTRLSLMFSKTFQTNFAKKQTKKPLDKQPIADYTIVDLRYELLSPCGTLV